MFIFGLPSTSDDRERSKQKTSTETQNTTKAPKSSKNKMFIFGFVQPLMIDQAIWEKTSTEM